MKTNGAIVDTDVDTDYIENVFKKYKLSSEQIEFVHHVDLFNQNGADEHELINVDIHVGDSIIINLGNSLFSTCDIVCKSTGISLDISFSSFCNNSYIDFCLNDVRNVEFSDYIVDENVSIRQHIIDFSVDCNKMQIIVTYKTE